MSASYNKIDYRLRLAKSVERKMMCSVFQQLAVFYPLKEYKYVGFGSVAFLDFALIHRTLGIDLMYSMERQIADKERFEFNKPFDCINLRFGESQTELPLIKDIESKSIIWLDYDGKLSTPMLEDISLLFKQLTPGSLFCISYNSQPDTFNADSSDDLKKERLQSLLDRIDNQYLPEYLLKEPYPNLNKIGLRSACYDIIDLVIKDALKARHSYGEDIKAEQIFFFSYNDGAEMNTIGWLFYDDKTKDRLESFNNSNLPFVVKDNTPFEIIVPKLTFKEMKELEAKFPNINNCLDCFEKLNAKGILPRKDIEDYYKIYKNFSPFAEVGL